MTKKKKEIIDDELELITPDVEEKMFKKSMKFLIENEEEFHKKAFGTPAKILRGNLTEVALFLCILIEKLDIDFFNANDMLSYIDDTVYAHKYKKINIKYTGNDEDKQFLLKYLSHLVDRIDYTRVRLFYELEPADDKSGLLKKWEEEQKKKRKEREEE